MATITLTESGASSITLLSLVGSDGTIATVPVPATFTAGASSTWSIAFTGPAPTYTYTALASLSAGGTQVLVGTVAGDGAGTPTGYYAGLADLQTEFGSVNVATWSNLDNNPPVQSPPTINNTRVQQALTYADRKINDIFSNSVYAIPLTFSGGTISPVVVRWAATIAAAWLYTSRGKFESVPSGAPKGLKQVDRFSALMEGVHWEMHDYLAGIRQLNAATNGMISRAPAVVSGNQGGFGRCF